MSTIREIPAGHTFNVPGTYTTNLGGQVNGKSLVVPGPFTIKDGGTLHLHENAIFMIVKVGGVGLVVEAGGQVIEEAGSQLIELELPDAADFVEQIETSVTPGADLIPRAAASGLIDSDWLDDDTVQKKESDSINVGAGRPPGWWRLAGGTHPAAAEIILIADNEIIHFYISNENINVIQRATDNEQDPLLPKIRSISNGSFSYWEIFIGKEVTVEAILLQEVNVSVVLRLCINGYESLPIGFFAREYKFTASIINPGTNRIARLASGCQRIYSGANGIEIVTPGYLNDYGEDSFHIIFRREDDMAQFCGMRLDASVGRFEFNRELQYEYHGNTYKLLHEGDPMPSHAETHATGGSDPLTAEDIGAAVATSRVPSGNANDIAASGFYTTNNSQNCPHSNNHLHQWWTIIHANPAQGNKYSFQMASYFFGTELWHRQCYNGNWQPWQELYHTGNLSPVSLDDFTAWQTMGLINGWGLSGTYPPEYKPAYRKTPFGTVELRGRTRYSHLPTQPTTGHFATLPSGYRPAKKVSLAGSDGDIHIYPGGECYIQQDGGSYPLGVYLDGLFFSTDPEV